MAADFGGLLAKSRAMKAPKLEATPELEVAEPVEGEEDEEEGMVTRLKPIAQDLISALRGGDATAVAEALMAVHSAIGSGPSEAEGEIE